MTIYNLNSLPDVNRIFVFDTNILLYLNGIYSKKKVIDSYTKIACFLIKNRAKIYLDTLVFNEFVNRFIRDKLGHSFEKQKDRNTKEYDNCLTNINTIINGLKNTYNITWSSNKINLFNILENVDYKKEFNQMEFSDWTIKETVKNINGILITHDKDFFNSAKNNEFDIFTIQKF